MKSTISSQLQSKTSKKHNKNTKLKEKRTFYRKRLRLKEKQFFE